mmetsp:Transcript_39974/g.52286  ORF Transcript_39974/g.52286 Transcript_39974/m.52286 type:complete len:105 (-) Transcript_39974:568-882(-)
MIALLFAYSLTVITLYNQMKLLENMQEEQRAIIKQVLAFYAALLSNLLFQGYYMFIEWTKDENTNYAKLAFRLCWIEVVAMSINKGVPLLYMLLTHVKTYRTDR